MTFPWRSRIDEMVVDTTTVVQTKPFMPLGGHRLAVLRGDVADAQFEGDAERMRAELSRLTSERPPQSRHQRSVFLTRQLRADQREAFQAFRAWRESVRMS